VPGPTAVAIASESPYTVEAGAALAEAGGNAVDIAVGAALAATVSESLMCSLGGSAFVNIKLPVIIPVYDLDQPVTGTSRSRVARDPTGN